MGPCVLYAGKNNLNECNAGISCIQLYIVSHCPPSVLEIVHLAACLLHGYLVLSDLQQNLHTPVSVLKYHMEQHMELPARGGPLANPIPSRLI